MRLRTAIENFNAIHQALLDDILSVFSKPKEKLDLGRIQQIRRAHLRAVFVHFEAIIFQVKQLALVRGEMSGLRFSACELSLLREEEHSLNDKGEPTSRPARLRLSDNFKFATKLFSSAYCCSYCPDYGSHKWESFQRAQKIRNRVTHPKTAAHLEISDQELQVIDEAFDWVYDWHLELFKNACLIAKGHRKRPSTKTLKSVSVGRS